ncbi:uncharacterized protein PGTG_15962 [Puccinia graminis f. sp. tritici CRL 75-36-700-3]|uniref:Electron transfer flavoprotein-ubiquinone oxidoreductase n=1 Tax=Puccinia graminis f. sp. tritici (strain CRL 75-36-700-3 / race SCCL) TaxID=418459 RepID=E3L0R0_PUCGT|nr:uncharacterized protein PGTG_15962 [Puccinia graminis f. sp. tritici CRL 75-36-700-3]EFP90114.2 hypothetical protein PGTG_15962 [Puccinia graminis f. sp. tritici CRL 75-36-700-3]
MRLSGFRRRSILYTTGRGGWHLDTQSDVPDAIRPWPCKEHPLDATCILLNPDGGATSNSTEAVLCDSTIHYGQLAVAAARSVTQTFQVKPNPHATSAAETTQTMKRQITLHLPLQRQKKLTLGTLRSAFPLPHPPQMNNKVNYIVSLRKVRWWLAEQAEALGVKIYSGFAGAKLLYSDDGKAGD